MTSKQAKNFGVLVFKDDCSKENLAAFQWAADSLSDKQVPKKLVIIVVKEVTDGSNDGGDVLAGDTLPTELGRDLGRKFDNKYKKKFRIENLSGKSYKGPSIEKMLENAIKDFKLDTLVLGLAVLRTKTTTLTPGRIIDLLLGIKCSVVLAKIEDEPGLRLKMKVEIEPMTQEVDNPIEEP